MLKQFIERPVLSTVISIILLLLGILSVFNLPITLFPDIAPPTVQVTAFYPGANAEVVARSVAVPIEEAVNGVENMTYMTSNSSNDGSMTLSVYFKQGSDPDNAAVNVQNRVSKAMSQLPQEVVQAGISTQKVQNSMIMFMGLSSDDPKQYDELFLQNYLKINVIPQIQRIPGVAQAQVFGTQDYSMRIWLKPDRLAANNLSPQEVMTAIKDHNLEAAPGRLGQGSKETYEYILKYKGKLNKNADYENIAIKANDDGSFLRLKDVARVEFGSYTYTATNRVDGKPVAGFAILQTAGSNANEILTEIEKQVDELKTTLPKGVNPIIMYNSKDFLDASIDQVVETLVIAFILVFIVVYIFLQDFRSTLIPAIAVPVAIIGTFFFLQLFGFSINMLTLFALILAIGIVVDDAIVVVEAVHSKMEHTGMPVENATVNSMSEISGAIISITLVMCAVFIPVGFMQGPAGVFYRQFAFTLVIAILISAVNALTLSPALCALFLKDPQDGEHGHEKKGFGAKFFNAFNTSFNNMTQKYIYSLKFLIKNKWVAVGGLAVLIAASVILIKKAPSGFIPTEDQGFVLYAVNTPPGSSLDRTQRATKQIDKIVNGEKATNHLWVADGVNFISNANASPYSAGFIKLKDIDKRGDVKDPDQIAAGLTGKVSQVKDASAFFFNFPTIQGFGNVSGFEFMLQDKTNGSFEQLGANTQAFIGELMKRKEIAFAFTTYAAGNPQYTIEVDADKANQLGVSVTDLMQTMQIYFGSSFVSDFNRFGKYYRVMAQADIPYRTDINSLEGIYVKNKQGEMVPTKTLVTLKRTFGPETVTRNNLFNAVTINGTPKPGYSTGDAIKAVEEVAKQSLPRGYGYEWTGITREEIKTSGQTAFIFMLSILFVYFLLAAQYESYILPFAIILTVPTGIFGVFAFTGLAGIDNNIYVQVGLIMLVGLLAKNAILIVEFAVQRRKAGKTLIESALQASRLRLRPILMTSFAFIIGMLPLVWTQGASAKGNHSIGISTVGGMLTGVIFGIFIIPVMYVIFQYLHEKMPSRKKRRLQKQNQALAPGH
ncbi:efflux RND transporter permease subunit [Chryseobacterium sp. PTM-20240506]|uniref:efflux RND transporter permease subunit n=1 Tax=unclassified Chryseobacterium TaxID=2593645 RepID=UPI00235856A2|nr:MULTISPECIES: efflux RND transporter permease subunit [unclassified Chryseobacterium]MDC8105297.1 efflux RND transporter permease subunit [Chryseobacterium sp. B21-037]MDQ1805554.1 efflux RND transporter permease subunit [Chryseobacterium sp. CKR4-1]WBV58707.1 efflux RND transporter permease subunit [Chryseobacterium daecheongense]